MEEQYWKHFMETGNVSDYLNYKMEVYGHSTARCGQTEDEQQLNTDCIRKEDLPLISG